MSSNDEEECKRIIKIKDYYEILGVPKTADETQIKKAYRKLAVKFHPDKNKAKSAEEAFKKVNQAFTVLSDKQKRQNYDTFGTEDVGASPFSGNFDPMEVFNQFFGGGFGDIGMNMGSGTRIRFSNGNGTFTMFSSGGFGGEPGEDIFEQFFNFGPSQRRRRTNRERSAENEERINQQRRINQIVSWILLLCPLFFCFFFVFLPFLTLKFLFNQFSYG